ncbi:MAG TPA: glycosyltransferase [Bacillota bacterium]|nr:glycosyltransferase [Bacillota bacterium]
MSTDDSQADNKKMEDNSLLPGVSVTLLCYKEGDNLKILLPRIIDELKKLNTDYEINLIDTEKVLDDTPEVAKQFKCNYYPQEEPYFGGAFRTGIRKAKYKSFFIMDSDGSHDPKYIPDIYYTYLAGADVAIGSRYVEGGISNDSKSSHAMSLLLNGMFRIALGIKARDISTDFRMYHTAELKKLDLKCDNYDILQEVILKLKINNKSLRINETPIQFDKRIMGESKRRLIPFIVSYVKTLVRLSAVRISARKDPKRIEKTEAHVDDIIQFVLYLIFGLFAALVDFGVFNILMHITGKDFMVMNNLIAAFLGFTISFTFNSFFTFVKTNKMILRFMLYLFICSFGMTASSLAVKYLGSNLNPSLLKAMVISVLFLIQYAFNRFITFRIK